MDRQILIADDDPGVCRALRLHFARHRPVAVALSAVEAIRLIETTPRWSGAIIDYNFPDGNGLDVLSVFRLGQPLAPVLMLTGVQDRDVNHRATALGAQFVMKPVSSDVLKAFATRLSERKAPAEVGLELERVVAEFALSPGEARIVDAAVRGVGRNDLAEHLGLAESTIKTQIGRLVAKCQVLQLSDVVRIVWERSAKLDR
ncbi:MAG: response regulator [Polyangiales bacterium]